MRTSSLLAAVLLSLAFFLPGALSAGEVAEVRLENAQGPALPLNPAAGPSTADLGMLAQADVPASVGPAPAAPQPAGAAATPAQIIIIRHAEKEAQGNDLSPQGYQRAQALVGFFESNPAVTQYGTPAAIYAMKPKADGKDIRPLETVTPLAQSLGLTVNTTYPKEDVNGLAQAILSDPSYTGKMVLIAWEHHFIPSILTALGWTQGPTTWPGDAYDRAWILNFDGGKPVSFQDVSQPPLPGGGAQ